MPVFMFMSFVLTQRIFLSNDSEYIRKRFWRLIFPHIGWAVLYWVPCMAIKVCFGIDWMELDGISDLIWQIFTGHSPHLNPAMWYQINLIVISSMFFVIFKILPFKKGMFCTYIFLVFALLMQYTGINYALFSNLRYELKYPLGRLSEVIPYAVIGFSFAYYGILSKLKKYRIIVISGSIVIGLLLVKKSSLLPSAEGFGYSGIQAICIAILLVTVAVLLPLDCLPERIKKIVLIISKYTLGIYCMHLAAGKFIEKIVFEKMGMQKYTFSMCVIIYALCYLVAFVIARIPGKLCKQLVE